MSSKPLMERIRDELGGFEDSSTYCTVDIHRTSCLGDNFSRLIEEQIMRVIISNSSTIAQTVQQLLNN